MVGGQLIVALENQGWSLLETRRLESREELTCKLGETRVQIDAWHRSPAAGRWQERPSFIRFLMGEFEGPTMRWALLGDAHNPVQVAAGARWSMIGAGFSQSDLNPSETRDQLQSLLETAQTLQPKTKGDVDVPRLGPREWPFEGLEEATLGRQTWHLRAGGGGLTAVSIGGALATTTLTGLSELLLYPLGIVGVVGLSLLTTAATRTHAIYSAHEQARATIGALKTSTTFNRYCEIKATKPRLFSVASREPRTELLQQAKLQGALLGASSSQHDIELRLRLNTVIYPEGIAPDCMILPPSWVVAEFGGNPDALALIPVRRHEHRTQDRIRWLMDSSELDRGKLSRWLGKLDTLLSKKTGPYR